jgi:diaminopimelate epimerase
MTEIPFTKAHGARNDFLLTWAADAPASAHATIATAICDRTIGPGADGWMLVTPPTEDCHATIRLWNSDGSEAEISGNGTRCAAAFLVDAGLLDVEVPILTGAGLKHLRVLERDGKSFVFEMNMGTPRITALEATLPLAGGNRTATLLDVGNPQCAVFVDDFGFDWRKVGAEIEGHPMFPNRTNVSFVHQVDEHTIAARFYERGAGVTMSSGTGSTGAAAAAKARGLVTSPVKVLTPAGPLELRWQNEAILLVGPAEIVVTGAFYHYGE